MIYITLVLKIFDLKYAQSTIEYEKKSYNFLSTSYDCVRGFKHDFSNIMQAIGGYILTEDLSGLKKYYSSVFKDCSELHKLSIFNKDVLSILLGLQEFSTVIKSKLFRKSLEIIILITFLED